MRAKLREMLVVSRFNRAKHSDGRNVRAGERAVVYHFLNTRTGRRDLLGEIGQSAGTIADDGGESAQAAIGDEPALNHAAENIRVNVSAT